MTRFHFEVSLTRNIHRIRIDPVEEARVFGAYLDEFGWCGLTDTASKISKSTTELCKRLELYDLAEMLLVKVKNAN